MKALFVHDTFYSRAPTGEVYSFGAFPYSLWQERFLPHFHQLAVIGRERSFEPSHAQTGIRSDGPGVRFVLLPSIHTAVKRIFGSGDVAKQIRNEVGRVDAVIVRGPTEFGMIAAKESKRVSKLTEVNLTKVKIPVAVEMSGCAFDHTWHHGSLTGKFYAYIKYWRARKMVKGADHVIYVTEKFLQRRYPSRRTTANASNVEIDNPSSDVLQKRLHRIDNQKSIIFGIIGNADSRLKGVDIAIAALTRIHYKLPPFELRVLGHHGPARRDNESFVRYDAPLTDKKDVFAWLDNIDVYLQPSRHEGLPRALIEAMSRACPALGSNVGGIPELLDGECIHRCGNVGHLALNILSAMNPGWQRKQAEWNFEKAKDYTREVLVPKREKFWADFAGRCLRYKNSQFTRKSKQKDVFLKI